MPASSRALRLGVLLLLMLLALAVLSGGRQVEMYGRYMRETAPAITLRLTELSSAMDEAAVLRHFGGVPLRCVTQGPGQDSLGDRVCYADIDRADDDAALMLAVFFRDGHLARVMVQLPWWEHGDRLDQLNAQWGLPRKAGRAGLLGPPVLRWSMPNGTVEFTARRELNPLGLNVLLWSAA